MSSTPRWISIKVPAKLVDELDRIMPETTYPSRSQFVSEAIRKRLQELQLHPKKKHK